MFFIYIYTDGTNKIHKHCKKHHISFFLRLLLPPSPSSPKLSIYILNWSFIRQRKNFHFRMAASSFLTMDNSRTRQNMSGSANWSQQTGRTSTSSLEDLEIPKFRSFAPSFNSTSPSLVSPSTCFSPSLFLDSPAFVSSSANVSPSLFFFSSFSVWNESN